MFVSPFFKEVSIFNDTKSLIMMLLLVIFSNWLTVSTYNGCFKSNTCFMVMIYRVTTHLFFIWSYTNFCQRSIQAYIPMWIFIVYASVGSPRRHRVDANKISIETVMRCYLSLKQKNEKKRKNHINNFYNKNNSMIILFIQRK